MSMRNSIQDNIRKKFIGIHREFDRVPICFNVLKPVTKILIIGKQDGPIVITAFPEIHYRLVTRWPRLG